MCAEWIYDAVTRASDGDAEAFSALVEEYGPDVLRLCMVITTDRGMAEDASQETWRKVWSGLDRLRDRAKLRAWLLRVAANEAKQQLRRSRRHAWLSLDSASAAKGDDDPAEAVGMRSVRILRITERAGADFAALAVTETAATARLGPPFGRTDDDAHVETLAVVGVDYVLAPR